MVFASISRGRITSAKFRTAIKLSSRVVLCVELFYNPFYCRPHNGVTRVNEDNKKKKKHVKHCTWSLYTLWRITLIPSHPLHSFKSPHILSNPLTSPHIPLHHHHGTNRVCCDNTVRTSTEDLVRIPRPTWADTGDKRTRRSVVKRERKIGCRFWSLVGLSTIALFLFSKIRTTRVPTEKQ